MVCFENGIYNELYQRLWIQQYIYIASKAYGVGLLITIEYRFKCVTTTLNIIKKLLNWNRMCLLEKNIP